MNDETLRQRRSGDWCILRTSGFRTLPLAKSLAAAGFEVWTPKEVHTRRQGPARQRAEFDAPILPTFVFARADRVRDLVEVQASPTSPHPGFSIFRYYGRIPLLADGSIGNLRQVEIDAAERWRLVQAEEQRRAEHDRLKDEQAAQARRMHVDREQREALRKALRATAPSYLDGAKVKVVRPEFTGLTGVVEGQKGRAAIVNFGGGMTLTIDAWLLSPDDLYASPAREGDAA